MLEYPPSVSPTDMLNAILNPPTSELQALVDKINEGYEPWDKVKYRAKAAGLPPEQLWAYVKTQRNGTYLKVWDEPLIGFSLTARMQKLCHEIDMSFGGSWINNDNPSASQHQLFLINSLINEAISSSQMEGASTTRRVAKTLLREGRHPTDRSQQMIWNNYHTIRYLVEQKNSDLTPELLLNIHRLMTIQTLRNEEDAGRLRTDDNVVVENAITHEIIHIPPAHQLLPNFVEQLCHFFNERDAQPFVHPVVRAIVVHFILAYMHPFVDGNGRTARALFYFYLLRQGYWLTQYLSISHIIQLSKNDYERAFQYAEQDGLDIGYFVHYHLETLFKAFETFQQHIQREQDKREETESILHIGHLNPRQADIIRLLRNKPQHVLTVKEHQTRHGISPTTAKSDIVGLLNRGWLEEKPFNKVKRGYIRGEHWNELAQLLSSQHGEP